MPKHRQAIATTALGRRGGRTAAIVGGLCAALALAATPATAAAAPFISPFSSTTTLASTVPANGDQNPYGIVTVPRSVGKLHAGDILVSNFNNEGPTDANGNPTSGGNQGEGTTIVQFNADGSNPRLFAQLDPADFRGGVGPDHGAGGAAQRLRGRREPAHDRRHLGHRRRRRADRAQPAGQAWSRRCPADPINGPWDMTSVSFGPLTELFVTNVLNGTVAASPSTVNEGTVVRILLVALPSLRPIVSASR